VMPSKQTSNDPCTHTSLLFGLQCLTSMKKNKNKCIPAVPLKEIVNRIVCSYPGQTWYDAQKFCRVKYTDLATVGNMDDNDELLTALGHDWTYSWIGLQKGGARRWMWSDGSGPASFYKWNGGEPSGDEWCVELSEEGGWNDLSCEDTKGCVCYERESKTRKLFHKSP
uniref:C-type lectin domain-containing protein n=1 Tax=Labrus bergylta TaxID=56723 RepID=A0A3Q3E9M7_9LABR